MSSRPIVVFGTVCLDRICRIPRLPKPGGYVEIEFETLGLGGEAANTALSLLAWGQKVRLIGNPAGKGPEGTRLLQLMREAGLPEPSQDLTRDTPVCDILITPDGERTMIGRGFNGLDMPSDGIPSTEGGQWFTADPNFGASSRSVSKNAKSIGFKTYLMDFYQGSDCELVSNCDVWQSSTDWVGARGDMRHNLEWCQAHADKHGCITVLTDGQNGLVAAEPNKPAKCYPALPVDKVIDATGAGDTFRAGVLYGLNRDWRLEKSLLFAAAAGALNTTTLGATASLPSVQDIEEFIAKNPAEAAQYA